MRIPPGALARSFRRMLYMFSTIRLGASLLKCMLAVLCSSCSLFEQRAVPVPNQLAIHQEVTKPAKPWVEIDSRHKRLTLHRPGHADVIFDGVAFGAAGVKEKHKQGDHVTPRGRYTIGWISKQSKFRSFIGLNYPSVYDAERGYRNGVINQVAFSRIRDSHLDGRTPPQNTALGGYIGIHGVGKGSIEIHRMANWTEGCIALDNGQIERLLELVSPGMEVEIR